MLATELIRRLEHMVATGGDRPVDVSVDISTEADPFARVFGIPCEVQGDGAEINILAEQR